MHKMDPEAAVIGIMPGSRKQEVARMLPVFLQTAELLQEKIGKCVFLLPLAATLSQDDLKAYGIESSGLDIRIIKEKHYEAMAVCDAAMAASGTLTLELAILQVPMVVSYRVSMLTYLLARPFIRVQYASLVNLVAGKEVVPELLQDKATSQNIYNEISGLVINNQAGDSMRQELVQVVKQLGAPGGSRRTAEIALEMMTEGTPGG
jgi:lipid-A-disaccharide synthase